MARETGKHKIECPVGKRLSDPTFQRLVVEALMLFRLFITIKQQNFYASILCF